MITNISVIGGLYREISLESDLLLGSGGRASLFLSAQNVDVDFYTSATDQACKSFLASKKGHVFSGGKIDLKNEVAESDINFVYRSYLFEPLITGSLSHSLTLRISTQNCLYFGMLGVDVELKAIGKVVYDPQNTSNPQIFNNNSVAKELAVVLNEHEAKAMVGDLDIEALIKAVKLVNKANVVVLKRGPYGAVILMDDQISYIPAFLSQRFHKIGSGDIFSACFAYSWIVENLDPLAAALRASKAVSIYLENQRFDHLSDILTQNFIELDPQKIARKIYLAGPFFSISELWLVEKIKTIFELYNIEVFSPYHDVGLSNNYSEIAQADLQGLEQADNIFAIANNFDPGTVFEIGYARALNKNVFMYLVDAAKKDLAMFEGTECFMSDNIDYLIYKAIWNQ